MTASSSSAHKLEIKVGVLGMQPTRRREKIGVTHEAQKKLIESG
jgi:hypothetical protein